MTQEKTVTALDLKKALDGLQELSKGHASRGTAATQVETMSGVSGSPQIFHTASNSNPGSWAGSTESMVPDNGASDSIDANGTDYHARMTKSIMDKLSSGVALTKSEYDFVNKGQLTMVPGDKAEKGLPPFKKDGDEDEDDKGKDDKGKDDKKPFGKSLAALAAESDELNKGFEISSFLSDFVETISKALDNQEKRILQAQRADLVAFAQEQGGFQKSLAGSLGALGAWVAQSTQRLDQVEQTPARGPKSQVSSYVEKSFAGAPASEEQLSKSQVAAELVGMVHDKQIPADSVIKFELSNDISPELMGRVHARRNGRK